MISQAYAANWMRFLRSTLTEGEASVRHRLPDAQGDPMRLHGLRRVALYVKAGERTGGAKQGAGWISRLNSGRRIGGRASEKCISE